MTELLPDISAKLDHILAGLPGLLPEVVLAATFIVSIFTGLLADRHWRHTTFAVTVLGIILSAVANRSSTAAPSAENLLFGMVLPDAFAQNIRILTAAACLLFAVFVQSSPDFSTHKKKTADLFSILLAIHIGLNLLGMATNWLLVFVSMELVSIGSYILVGYRGREAQQAEAAMKYVLFGAVCSAVMLYGLSFLYGLTGTLDFTSAGHIKGLADTSPLLLSLALLLVIAGIGFKLSFVPFHFWAPDVYQGAPTAVTAFLSTAPKIAGIALLARILYAWPADGPTYQYLRLMLVISSAATMLLGNLAALRQTNVKRMMAYSSIGHTGFLMMAVLAYSAENYAILLFYLAAYLLMNMGVFMLAGHIEARTGAIHVEQYRGLGKTMPTAMVSFVILLVSLTGLPPTAGFVAKLLVFSAAFNSWQTAGSTGMMVLLIIGALTTVISLFYYFKIPLNAFLRKQEKPHTISPQPFHILWLAAVIAAALLLLGIAPGWIVETF